MRWALLAAALASAAVPPARAERPVDLRVRALPVATPATLAMRPRRPAPIQVPAELRTAQASAGQPAARAPAGEAGTSATVLRTSEAELGDPIKRLEEKVIFRFSLGFGIDGGQQSKEPPLVGGTLERGVNYAPLRSYGFGDVVLGTRGLLMKSLGSYFATEFRADYSGRLETPFTGAVPSVYYADDDTNKVLFRQGYAEIDGFFERKWLKPIYFRAGRQFKYGVGVVHFDGSTLGYDTKIFAFHLWSGERVSLYGFDELESPPLVVGSGARLDLFEWKRIPVVLTTDTLDLEGSNHREFGLAFRWSENVMIRASARRLGSHFARQTLRVWTRLSEVTTVNVDLDNRTEYDWMYDLWMLRPVDAVTAQPGDPRPYLNLGTPLPRLQLAARAGTVILRNLDVLLRAAAAIEHAGEDQDSEFSPSYLEAGGAIEVRLRRNLRLGSTFVARRYGRDARDPIAELPGPQPIPDPGDEIGDRSFYEGGLGVDYSVGARRFNASAELYGRAYDRASPYEEVVTEGRFDTHSGGRFSVEGWARDRIRIRAEYDVSLGPLDVAPELRGVKILRVLTEGTF